MSLRLRDLLLPVIFVLVTAVIAGATALGLTADPAKSNDTVKDSRSYHFDHADTAVAVNPDGSLHVTEQLGFDFDGTFHGAFRDIPLRSGEKLTKVRVSQAGTVYTGGASMKLGSSGRAGTFGTVRKGRVERVVWHYAQSGPATFQLDYDLAGAVHVRGFNAELNYQVWGKEWIAPLDDLTASVTVPEGQGDGTLHAWAHSKYAKATASVNASRARLHATHVPKRHLVELHVVFPADRLSGLQLHQVINDKHPISIAKIDKRERGYAKDAADRRDARASLRHHAFVYGAIGWVLALVLGAGVVWLLWRALWREDDRIVHATAADAVPPDDLSPAIVTSLVLQKTDVGDDALVATLLEVVRRGRFKTIPAQSEAKGAQVDVALLQGDTAVSLSPVEQPVAELVELLLAKHPDGVPMGQVKAMLKADKALATDAYVKVTEFRAAATAEVKAADWSHTRGIVRVAVTLGVSVLAAIIALSVTVDAFTDYSFGDVGPSAVVGIAFAGIVVALVLCLCMPRLYRVYRPEAVEQAARWRGFAKYLREMTDLGHEQTASLPLWERILVYGAAFGLATDVVNAVKPEVDGAAIAGSDLSAMSSLAWINAGSFAAFSSVGSSVSSVGAPSSSGGGGGGFGGGSGGGGGGAW